MSDIEILLKDASKNDMDARQQLLMAYRDRLEQMVQMRMDRRLKSRFDPADVVQEALVIADQRLDDTSKSDRSTFIHGSVRSLGNG